MTSSYGVKAMKAKLFRSVPFARTGLQYYAAAELNEPGDGLIAVNRTTAEVKRSAPSFEGVPITMDHPSEMVNAQSLENCAVGLITSVHFDQASQQLKGDILIWDPVAIHSVSAGRRELSAGYEADFDKTATGFTQTKIKGNHVALVPQGRSGAAQRIGG